MDAFLLIAIAINIGIYGGFGYLLGLLLRSRFPQLRPLLCSFGCLAAVFLLPWVFCGIPTWIDARSSRPFILHGKNVSSFAHHHTIDNVGVGSDLYLLRRLRDAAFDGKEAFHSSSYDELVAVELIVFNGTDSSIGIAPVDLDLTYNGQRIGAQVVGYETAQGHLRSFGEVVLGTGGSFSYLPHEPICGFPLSVALAPRDWVWVQQRKDAMSENEFEFGQINPSQTRHGFVYFEAGRTNVQSNDFLSPSGWGFEVTIHDGLREATLFSFEFGK